MFSSIPTGQTVYDELDDAIADSYAGAILITRFESAAIETGARSEMRDAIDEDILAGLVCP